MFQKRKRVHAFSMVGQLYSFFTEFGYLVSIALNVFFVTDKAAVK
jgi:hypothetical protein